MSPKTLGKPLELPEPQQPVLASGESDFEWRLSDEARNNIEEIEANIRSSEERCGSIILR